MIILYIAFAVESGKIFTYHLGKVKVIMFHWFGLWKALVVSFLLKIDGTLEVAEQCFKQNKDSWMDACVNRAYYGLFWLALEVLSKRGSYIQLVEKVLRSGVKDFRTANILRKDLKEMKEGRHKYPGHGTVRVLLWSLRDGESDWKTLAKALSELWDSRVKADYRPEFCTKQEARKCLKRCKEQYQKWRKSLANS